MPVKDVGGLPRRKTRFRPVNRDVCQFQHATALANARLTFGRRDGRKRRYAQLYAPMQLEEFDLQVDGWCELGMTDLEGP